MFDAVTAGRMGLVALGRMEVSKVTDGIFQHPFCFAFAPRQEGINSKCIPLSCASCTSDSQCATSCGISGGPFSFFVVHTHRRIRCFSCRKSQEKRREEMVIRERIPILFPGELRWIECGVTDVSTRTNTNTQRATPSPLTSVLRIGYGTIRRSLKTSLHDDFFTFVTQHGVFCGIR